VQACKGGKRYGAELGRGQLHLWGWRAREENGDFESAATSGFCADTFTDSGRREQFAHVDGATDISSALGTPRPDARRKKYISEALRQIPW